MKPRDSGLSLSLVVSVAVHAGALTVWPSADVPVPSPATPPMVLFQIREIASESTAPAPPARVEPPSPAPPPAAAPRPKAVSRQARRPPVAAAPPAPAPPVPVVAAAPSVVARAPTLDPVVRATYERLLLAWLERFKQYPRNALRRGIEGRPVVEVRIARDGRLLGHRLTGPSGHAMLNDAALAMIARAQPFPPLPRDYPKQSFVYRFGVDFEIAGR